MAIASRKLQALQSGEAAVDRTVDRDVQGPVWQSIAAQRSMTIPVAGSAVSGLWPCHTRCGPAPHCRSPHRIPEMPRETPLGRAEDSRPTWPADFRDGGEHLGRPGRTHCLYRWGESLARLAARSVRHREIELLRTLMASTRPRTVCAHYGCVKHRGPKLQHMASGEIMGPVMSAVQPITALSTPLGTCWPRA